MTVRRQNVVRSANWHKRLFNIGPRRQPAAASAMPPPETRDSSAPRRWCATTDAAVENIAADSRGTRALVPSSGLFQERGSARSRRPTGSAGSPAWRSTTASATAARIRVAGVRRRHWAIGRGSKAPSARSRCGFRHRTMNDPSRAMRATVLPTDRSRGCRSRVLLCLAPGR